MNRRRLVASTVPALSIMGVLPVASRAQQATPAAGSAWSFTDDRGRTVELPTVPGRIVADAAAGVALAELGIQPVGLFGYPGLFELPEAVAGLPFIDVSNGELDLEQVVDLAPDLLVGQVWDSTNLNAFAQMDETALPGLLEIAPTVALLAVDVALDHSLTRFEELAASLGADLSAPAVTASRDEFTAAAERVRGAAAAKPDLKVMAFTPYPDSLWIGDPTTTSDLKFFTELGVNLFVPGDNGITSAGVFAQLSWEEIGSFPIDLYLRDSRSDTMTPEDLLAHPVFSTLPAAGAEGLGEWTVQYFPTHGYVAGILNSLADALDMAEVVAG